MSWNYSGDPSTSELDQVRFYLQDTDATLQLLTDEEINFLLTDWRDSYDSPLWVAAVAAELVAAKMASLVSVASDGTSVDLAALYDRYNTLAVSLRDQYEAKYSHAGPLLNEILAIAPDPSIPALVFGHGFQDNFWAGRQDYGDRGEDRVDFELRPGQ